MRQPSSTTQSKPQKANFLCGVTVAMSLLANCLIFILAHRYVYFHAASLNVPPAEFLHALLGR